MALQQIILITGLLKFTPDYLELVSEDGLVAKKISLKNDDYEIFIEDTFIGQGEGR